MGLEVSLPFVSDVYTHVAAGKLDECAEMLREIVKHGGPSIMDCVLTHSFMHERDEFVEWLCECADECAKELDEKCAICCSMGEFEINAPNWRAQVAFYEGYDNPKDPYEWLATEKRKWPESEFAFDGIDEVLEAFDDAYPSEDEEEIVDSTVYTAAVYLVFVELLRLIRDAHEAAKAKKHGIARAHFFAYYGDLLYHSKPSA